jgi:hypothetical protein
MADLPSESCVGLVGAGELERQAIPIAVTSFPPDILRRIARLLTDEDVTCFRLSCMAARDNSDAPAGRSRSGFMRSAALAAFAWEALEGFEPADPAELCALAAGCGSLETLAWLHDRGCAWDASTCASAARGGHLAVLQWARARECAWDFCVCLYGASGGFLELLQWARAHGCEWNDALAITRAAQTGQVHVLRWIFADGLRRSAPAACYSAAQGGQLEALAFLRAQGAPWGTNVCQAAAAGGHLAVLQYAREHGCPWSACTCTAAAEYGQLEALRWARAHGCPWDAARICQDAANGGSVLVLEWLVDESERGGGGAAWTPQAAAAAALRGHLDVLRWAAARGLGMDAHKCFANALRARHADVADWVRAEAAARGDSTVGSRAVVADVAPSFIDFRRRAD